MSLPGSYSPTIYQGDDWAKTFQFDDDAGDPIDLSGHTLESQLRATKASDVVVSFTVDTTDAAAGTVYLSLAAADTAELARGFYFFDLQWTDASGDLRTVLAGRAEVVEEVTR